MEDHKSPRKLIGYRHLSLKDCYYDGQHEQHAMVEWLVDLCPLACVSCLALGGEREYVTFEEEQTLPYAGWMDQGKLHFATLQEAQDFVDAHVTGKDDTNLVDSIYDIYYVDWDNLEYESCQPTEIKVAHYWFNGDTGRQITWVADQNEKHWKTNWSKMECS